MARKSRTKKDRQLEELASLAVHNGAAIQEGPKRRTWSTHDLKSVRPLNEAQRQMIESYFTGNHIVASGSAGTGKSFIALFLALNDLLSKDTPTQKIIIVRSAVPSREIGFLPGSIEEKLAPYEIPYRDIIGDLLRYKGAYDSLKENGQVVFMPTSFVRGLTWDDAVVIIDETQNMMLTEINSIMTRVGDNSRVIVCGDVAQNDLNFRKSDVSGYAEALTIFSRMADMDIVQFTINDIVRSKFVRQWITEYQKV